MEILRLSKTDRVLCADIALDGSKSLSNRALIVLALAGADPSQWLRRLSASNDTATLRRLLAAPVSTYNAGDAGTTFRFLTAYLALQPGTQALTGSARLRQRPVGALVQALRALGADIEYLECTGYPPLRIGAPDRMGRGARQVHVDASVSSQFLSALLLIGPHLPEGLELIPEGALVSRPYLDMTVRLMQHFGARVAWQDGAICVEPGAYQPRPLTIEADWSAASYWYALAAFAGTADLTLRGLFAGSWQGDAVLPRLMEAFGVQTTPSPDSGSICLHRAGAVPLPSFFEWNFIGCPDIAQTLAVVCAGLGVPAVFSGLDTLAIKETDRCMALQTELGRVGVVFEPENSGAARYRLSGKAHWKQPPPRFATYGDHRMAMAFAPLAMFGSVELEDPAVVRKSYPGFWEHLAAAGFLMEKTTLP
jgi:3-phosphoshikimate 1-carboxyvinyltransferase